MFRMFALTMGLSSQIKATKVYTNFTLVACSRASQQRPLRDVFASLRGGSLTLAFSSQAVGL